MLSNQDQSAAAYVDVSKMRLPYRGRLIPQRKAQMTISCNPKWSIRRGMSVVSQ